ncbi:hypothetical protein PLICRDRAFT_180671 [Plicaturopsis crispa FD-325 SS-3]|uniref:Uncharacterized protein n=1 Tax=Plicaturopsis crispa FD-325 SS-3 TaxID=944288 RepID=A0A0C9SK61_PLICR|nr:hypothetical protein PLICRDRAFT_180671 [Plicaturopsis crispa FD-325 SS-3]
MSRSYEDGEDYSNDLNEVDEGEYEIPQIPPDATSAQVMEVLEDTQSSTRRGSKSKGKDKPFYSGAIERSGRKFGVMGEPWVSDRMIFRDPRPTGELEPFNVDRYTNPQNARRRLLEEIYSMIPPSLHQHVQKMDGIGQAFIGALNGARRTNLNNLRDVGGIIFGMDPELFFVQYDGRSQIPEFRRLLGMSPDVEPNEKYPVTPPVMFNEHSHAIFQHEALPKILKVLLFGKKSIMVSAGTRQLGPPRAAERWDITEVTPGAIALSVIVARYLLSPDTSFEEVGGKSGITYKADFNYYKRLLIETAHSPNVTYRANITSAYRFFNRAIFSGWKEASSRAADEANTVERDAQDMENVMRALSMQVADDEAARTSVENATDTPLSEEDDEYCGAGAEPVFRRAVTFASAVTEYNLDVPGPSQPRIAPPPRLEEGVRRTSNRGTSSRTTAAPTSGFAVPEPDPEAHEAMENPTGLSTRGKRAIAYKSIAAITLHGQGAAVHVSYKHVAFRDHHTKAHWLSTSTTTTASAARLTPLPLRQPHHPLALHPPRRLPLLLHNQLLHLPHHHYRCSRHNTHYVPTIWPPQTLKPPQSALEYTHHLHHQRQLLLSLIHSPCSRRSAAGSPNNATQGAAPPLQQRIRTNPHMPHTKDVEIAPATVIYWSPAPVHGVLPMRSMRAHSVALVDNTRCTGPTCRAPTATLVDRRLVIFGGGQGPVYYDTTYVLDTVTRTWTQVHLSHDTGTTNTVHPSPCRAHTAVLYKGKIQIFGSRNGMTALNDTWTLDVSGVGRARGRDEVGKEADGTAMGMRWEMIETRGRKPLPRGYHTANLVGNIMVVVGGRSHISHREILASDRVIGVVYRRHNPQSSASQTWQAPSAVAYVSRTPLVLVVLAPLAKSAGPNGRATSVVPPLRDPIRPCAPVECAHYRKFWRWALRKILIGWVAHDFARSVAERAKLSGIVFLTNLGSTQHKSATTCGTIPQGQASLFAADCTAAANGRLERADGARDQGNPERRKGGHHGVRLGSTVAPPALRLDTESRDDDNGRGINVLLGASRERAAQDALHEAAVVARPIGPCRPGLPRGYLVRGRRAAAGRGCPHSLPVWHLALGDDGHRSRHASAKASVQQAYATSPAFAGVRTAVKSADSTDPIDVGQIQDDIDGEQDCYPPVPPISGARKLEDVMRDASKGVTDATDAEYKRLNKQCTVFMRDQGLIAKDAEFFSSNPITNALLYIAAWIMHE